MSTINSYSAVREVCASGDKEFEVYATNGKPTGTGGFFFVSHTSRISQFLLYVPLYRAKLYSFVINNASNAVPEGPAAAAAAPPAPVVVHVHHVALAIGKLNGATARRVEAVSASIVVGLGHGSALCKDLVALVITHN